MELTIKQAISYASQIKKRISDARSRASSSLNHKAGEETPFSFQEMLAKSDQLSDELAAVQGKLAVANATNTVDHKGQTLILSHAIRLLQEMKGKIAWLNGLPVQATESLTSNEREWDETLDKSVMKKTVTFCKLPEAKRAELVDALQDEFNLLNGAVELVNQVVKLTI